VIGEYLGKLYVEAKRRPRYFIERIVEGRASAADPPRRSEAALSSGN